MGGDKGKLGIGRRWTALLVGAVVAGAALVAPPVQAAAIEASTLMLMNDQGVPSTKFGSSQVVLAAGTAAGGNGLIPAVDLYVVPNQTWDAAGGQKLVDWSNAQHIPQTAVGFEFVDLPLWIPYLWPGEWDVVVDKDQDGTFDIATDTVLGAGAGAGFTVAFDGNRRVIDKQALKDQYAKPWASAAAKAELLTGIVGAFQVADSVKGTTEWFTTMAAPFSVQSMDRDLACFTAACSKVDRFLANGIEPAQAAWTGGGAVPGIGDVCQVAADAAFGAGKVTCVPPTDFSGVEYGTEQLRLATQNLHAAADAIYADPPDSNYQVISSYTAPKTTFAPMFDDPMLKAQAALANTLNELSGRSMVLLHAIERFDGAALAHDDAWLAKQAEVIRDEAAKIAELLDTVRVQAAAARSAMESAGAPLALGDTSHLVTAQARLGSSGFSQAELDAFHAAGWTDADIAAFKAWFRALNFGSAPKDLAALLADLDALTEPAQNGLWSLAAYAAGAAMAPLASSPPTAAFSATPVVGDPNSFAFDPSASTDDGSIASYSWNFGDGQTSSEMTPTHRYAVSGTYTVTLEVLDNEGLSGSVTKTVTVANTLPTATFTANPEFGMVPVEVSFDATGSADPDGTITSYAWDFGDGATATGATTTHRFETPAEYTVVLRVTDDKGATADYSMLFYATPDPVPTAAFTVTPSLPLMGQQASFDASTSSDNEPIVSYAWDFGDGAVATGATVQHAFAASGKHPVKLTVTDSIGQVAEVTHDVVVPIPYTAGSDAAADYWLTFMRNYNEVPTLTVYVSGRTATTGFMEIPALAVKQPFSVVPGEITSVPIPAEAQTDVDGQHPYLGIHVSAGAPVTVYGLSRIQYTTDAYLGLPASAVGRRYVAAAYPSVGDYGTELSVVATTDDTSVTITPKTPLAGNPAGVPYTVTLDKGEVYAATSPEDLTGTVIESDKPVSAFSGGACSNIPVTQFYCDHIVEQLVPTTAWGTSFLSMPLATRLKGDTFRFIADQGDTHVVINGAAVATIPAGGFHEQVVTDPALITADKPIQVMQYSNGTTFDGVTSDPFMMTVPPYEQYLNDYVVTTPASGFRFNFINVIVPKSAVGSVTIDGTAIAADKFTAIPGTGFAGAQLDVALGSHTLKGPLPFGVHSYGYDVDDSYGYPGGMSFSPVATATSLTLSPANGTATVGGQACVTATVLDTLGNPVSGVRVDFSVSGVNPATGFAVTDAAGQAKYCFTGSTTGADTVTATMALLSAQATVTWSAAVHLPTVTITVAPLTNDSTPTVTGTTNQPDGSTVTVSEGATVLCTAIVNSGTWSCSPGSPLGDGPHTLTASITSPDGTGSATAETVVDTKGPAVVVSAPTEGSTVTSGIPTISGTSEPGATVTVTENAVTLCTATVATDGTWSCTPAAPLGEGSHTVSAVAKDPAGNTGPADTQSFTVDTTALPPGITSPTEGSSTGATTPEITGTGEPGATVTVTENGDPVCTATVGLDGTWGCTPTTPLPPGPHVWQAQQQDPAGNVSDPSSVTFEVRTATISGRVFVDSDQDTHADATERDIPGVTVSLMGAGPDAVLGTPDDEVVASTVTRSPFVFTEVPDGHYLVVVVNGPELAAYRPTSQPDGSIEVTMVDRIDVAGLEFGYAGEAPPPSTDDDDTPPLPDTGINSGPALRLALALTLFGAMALALSGRRVIGRSDRVGRHRSSAR